MLEIRKAIETDKTQIWEIIRPVIAAGDSYTFAPATPRETMLDYWFAADKHTYVAVWSAPAASAGGSIFLSEPAASASGSIALSAGANDAPQQIVGTFFLKPNQPDLGAHVANAGYMVATDAKGTGVGRAMAEFSLAEAKRLGFRAMQFNFVVKSNTVAVRLWQKLGFEIVGEIPDAFQHKEHGLTNAFVMYRKL